MHLGSGRGRNRKGREGEEYKVLLGVGCESPGTERDRTEENYKEVAEGGRLMTSPTH